MRSTSDPNDEDGRLHSRGRENCSRAASLKMLDQSEKSAQCWVRTTALVITCCVGMTSQGEAIPIEEQMSEKASHPLGSAGTARPTRKG